MVSQPPQLTLRCCRQPREGFPSFGNHYSSAKTVPLTMREGSLGSCGAHRIALVSGRPPTAGDDPPPSPTGGLTDALVAWVVSRHAVEPRNGELRR
jgi:hypothetical protein